MTTSAFTDPQGSHAVQARKAVMKTTSTAMNGKMNTKEIMMDAKNATLNVEMNMKFTARNAAKNTAIHAMNATAKAMKKRHAKLREESRDEPDESHRESRDERHNVRRSIKSKYYHKDKKTNRRRHLRRRSRNDERHHGQNDANKSEDTQLDEKATVAKNITEAAKRLDATKTNRTACYDNEQMKYTSLNDEIFRADKDEKNALANSKCNNMTHNDMQDVANKAVCTEVQNKKILTKKYKSPTSMVIDFNQI